MEKQEKINKLLCVLNSNLDKVEVDGTAIKFLVNTNGVNNRINLYKSTKNIPAVKETRYFFGFIPIQMTIKKSYEEPCAVVWSHFDGYSFSDSIDLEVFSEMHQRAVEIRDKTFIKKLNTYCDEQKE
jgi:hypothetical protein